MTAAVERAAVCVIGGGPGGASMAIRFAQLGHEVVLVERSQKLRRRSESLSSGVRVQLDVLGARRALEIAEFGEVRRTTLNWERGGAIVRDFGDEPSMLVDRARFDAALLEAARVHGVRVLQPASIRGRQPGDGGWHLQIASGDRELCVKADFVAFAGGRAASPDSRRRATGPRTLALHARWRGPGLPRQPWIEAGAREWYWGMPEPDGSHGITAFLDSKRLRGEGAASLPMFFDRVVAGAKTPAAWRDAVRVGRVAVAEATPYVVETPAEWNSIRVGEAALALDPLSSSGVQRAIQSALTAAIVVNTLLHRPADGAAALAFYRDHIAAAADRHRRWTASRYLAAGRDGVFWRARSVGAEPKSAPRAAPRAHPDLAVALAPEVEFVPTACIVGDFIVPRPAVRLPVLAEPVAFVSGQNIAALLEGVRPGMTARVLVESWSRELAPRSGIAILDWMLRNGILVPASQASPR